jgi:hypothetical protein
MLSVVTGDPAEIAEELLASADVDLVTFTGGVSIGKFIAAKAVYKRQVLELGGNDPLIVLADADLEEAAALAAAGSYRNSGQRCTAVKRMLVEESVADRFVELLVEKTRDLRYGDPFDPATDMGTLIDEAAARRCESVVNEAVGGGASREHTPRRLVFADRARPRCARDDGRTAGDIRPGVAGDPIQERRGGDPHRQRHRVRFVILAVHQSPRHDHSLRAGAARRQRERSRGAGLPLGDDAVRRHQGLGSWLQGRRFGGDEKLHQYQDLLAPLVTGNAMRTE